MRKKGLISKKKSSVVGQKSEKTTCSSVCLPKEYCSWRGKPLANFFYIFFLLTLEKIPSLLLACGADVTSGRVETIQEILVGMELQKNFLNSPLSFQEYSKYTF